MDCRKAIFQLVSIFLLVNFFGISADGATDDYQIGVYYFPGWKDKQPGAPAAYPWERIKKYPEREPIIGWYKGGDDNVMHQQLEWMYAYGIDYVVFDWYYGENKKVFLEHAVRAYLRADNRGKVSFSILWANHDNMPQNMEDWDSMIHYWVDNYFSKPEFYRIDGRPVVFVFSAQALKKQAESFGKSTRQLFARARIITQKVGEKAIYFVACTAARNPIINFYAKESGYSALSAYNYHKGPSDLLPSHSFSSLDEDYRQHWSRFRAEANLPLIVPITSGWDKRPWGGSKDPLHDNSFPKPREFKQHLEAAKTFMDENPTLTQKMGVICCWNEFGEGSVVEPTKKAGFIFLEQVRAVFSDGMP